MNGPTSPVVGPIVELDPPPPGAPARTNAPYAPLLCCPKNLRAIEMVLCGRDGIELVVLTNAVGDALGCLGRPDDVQRDAVVLALVQEASRKTLRPLRLFHFRCLRDGELILCRGPGWEAHRNALLD